MTSLESGGVVQVIALEGRRRADVAKRAHQVEIRQGDLDELAQIAPHDLANTEPAVFQPQSQPYGQLPRHLFHLTPVPAQPRLDDRRARFATTRSASCGPGAGIAPGNEPVGEPAGNAGCRQNLALAHQDAVRPALFTGAIAT